MTSYGGGETKGKLLTNVGMLEQTADSGLSLQLLVIFGREKDNTTVS